MTAVLEMRAKADEILGAWIASKQNAFWERVMQSSAMEQYYDITEQSRYGMTVTRPKKIEDLSDSFVTREELVELTGHQSLYIADSPGSSTTLLFHELIKAEVTKYAERLEVSTKKSIRITDQELLEALKSQRARPMTMYSSHLYCRHGDRIKYYKARRRVKKTATKGDSSYMWSIFMNAFHNKHGTHMPFIPMWYRTLRLFKAYKKYIGWKAFRGAIRNKDQVKFFRQVWDNPEEYYS